MKKKRKSRIPKVGDKIYIPTSIYLSHGMDDVDGGIATVKKVINEEGIVRVEVEEDPSTEYDWVSLVFQQDKLKNKFGDQKARKCPDMSLESNCWASPGDIVDGEKIDYYIP